MLLSKLKNAAFSVLNHENFQESILRGDIHLNPIQKYMITQIIEHIFSVNKKGCILSFPTGSGKTLSCITVVLILKYLQRILCESKLPQVKLLYRFSQLPTLIVTPNSLIPQWLSEITSHTMIPREYVFIYTNPRDSECYHFIQQNMSDISSGGIVICSSQTLTRATPESVLNVMEWSLIIYDECHLNLGKKTNGGCKMLHTLNGKFGGKILLSATVLKNNVRSDLTSYMYALGLNVSTYRYKQKMKLFEWFWDQYVITPTSDQIIQENKRKKVNISVHHIDMLPDQLTMYRHMIENKKMSPSFIFDIKNSINICPVMSSDFKEFVSLSGGNVWNEDDLDEFFSNEFPDFLNTNPKMVFLMNEIRKLRKGPMLLVLSRVEIAAAIAFLLRNSSIDIPVFTMHHMTSSEEYENAQEFLKQGDQCGIVIALCTPSTLTGHNFPNVESLVFLTFHFNQSLIKQGIGRLTRPGRVLPFPPRVVIILYKNSIEDAMMRLSAHKQKSFNTFKSMNNTRKRRRDDISHHLADMTLNEWENIDTEAINILNECKKMLSSI